MLARMFAGDMTPSIKDKQGRYCIDRSGRHFGTVLAYLRGERVDRSLVEEAHYYQARCISKHTNLPQVWEQLQA